MFVESFLEDAIKIYPITKNIEETIYEVLTAKYRNRYNRETGLGIFIKKEFEILERKCVEDFVLYTVKFTIFFFRFLKNELIEVNVLLQNEIGVQISIKFCNKIFIPIEHLPDNSEITYIYDENKLKQLAWVWNYKGNRYIVKTGEKVKFKVVEYNCDSKMVIGSFSDSGLGPVSWWQ